MQTLEVYFQTMPVGMLQVNKAQQLSFQYQQDYLANPSAMPISLALPLQSAPFQHETTRAFFANLLPEGQVRARLSRILGINSTNDFGLLAALGSEMAGALSLRDPQQPGHQQSHALQPEQLKKIPHTLVTQRLSLSGAQSKLPIHIEQNQLKLPHVELTSNYILKTALSEFPHSIENEWFCMKLARAIGLPVPSVNKLRDPELYLVKRFDRKQETNGVQTQLHQEDFCQALGIAPEQKYEIAGGPSLLQCFNLLRKHSSLPARDLHLLLQWVIFNFLIGNSDGHGKNIALFLNPSGVQLAPFYDLISTAVYPELTNKLAMHIGGEIVPETISLTHWHAFANEVGIKTKFLEKTLKEVGNKVWEKSNALWKTMPQNEIVPEIIAVIKARLSLLSTY